MFITRQLQAVRKERGYIEKPDQEGILKKSDVWSFDQLLELVWVGSFSVPT